jgi:DMSO/TMAO reductase YedYZ molybdopterin-dependent catalytic subunit
MKWSKQLGGLAGAKPVIAVLVLLTCFGTQATPQAAAEPGRLAITGAVERPLNLQISDLEKMPHMSVEVKDHDGNLTTYEGVPLAELLKAAGAPVGEKLRGAVCRSSPSPLPRPLSMRMVQDPDQILPV